MPAMREVAAPDGAPVTPSPEKPVPDTLSARERLEPRDCLCTAGQHFDWSHEPYRRFLFCPWCGEDRRVQNGEIPGEALFEIALGKYAEAYRSLNHGDGGSRQLAEAKANVIRLYRLAAPEPSGADTLPGLRMVRQAILETQGINIKKPTLLDYLEAKIKQAEATGGAG